ncbi:hypothetical protein D3C86_1561100 [compost metagenome]|jgi:hypothetical protein
MENLHNYSEEELQKCPYHQQLRASEDKQRDQNANTGDWEDERDQDGTDPDRYEEEGGNSNSGGAGSTGSAATNS